jgi:hypothetical protein
MEVCSLQKKITSAKIHHLAYCVAPVTARKTEFIFYRYLFPVMSCFLNCRKAYERTETSRQSGPLRFSLHAGKDRLGTGI